MTPEGTCPSCGRTLARAEAATAPPVGEGAPAADAPSTPPARLTGADLRRMAGEDARAPWHFKLMVAALALYLGWRAVQLVLLIFR